MERQDQAVKGRRLRRSRRDAVGALEGREGYGGTMARRRGLPGRREGWCRCPPWFGGPSVVALDRVGTGAPCESALAVPGSPYDGTVTETSLPDFRSEPMESPEGRGYASRAWAAYAKKTNQLFGPALRPLVEPAARKLAPAITVDLFGFWLIWHLEGGFEGLRRTGMSRSAVYRRIKLFRAMTGMHPDEYVLPGVTPDLETYRSTKPYRREG